MSTTGDLHNLEWYSGVPRSIRNYVLFGLGLIFVTFAGFGSWAATAPLSAAVIAPGSFVATGENKIVQHFEGGIVKDLLVREGDHVTQGQPLLLLDPTAAHAGAQQLQLRLIRLEMVWTRLNAVANHLSEMVLPASVTGQLDNPEVAAIIESQRGNFEAASSKLENETALMQQNIAALDFRVAGRRSQIESMQRQLALLREDQTVMLDLRAKGVTTQSDVRTIERSVADAEGDIARLESEVQEAQAQAEKFRREIIQANDTIAQSALDEMQSVEAELDAVREQIQQANSVLARTTISAPVTGTVVRMFYHTTGGVIESGKPIFEILPAEVPLIVEVKIPRMQIDEVRQGEPATVRLTALNQRTTPVLDGEVIYVSADTIADAADMNHEVYIARVGIAPEQLARVEGFHPTPGMPAEVFVKTRERTFLEYLVKPVTDSMSRAFHEN
ncbi:MAG: HlyD family type I secretion periplasmic adaptor subunit [Candidatus Devosia phytovorans]|uniref:Membrane fusion protein (MFP) family protein n=1 Tax=Candidatus Devosia phytovorans TaxID=3121372 RepID=A0AAJ5VSU7_9HYPH|nr:HlyD family type I secretion periplasmic adaptor subunit [Devosia sp.]WEK02898.1 MAG: HlyD family type I secretion periplasmic adaptor subunit [Devosia sp.]